MISLQYAARPGVWSLTGLIMLHVHDTLTARQRFHCRPLCASSWISSEVPRCRRDKQRMAPTTSKWHRKCMVTDKLEVVLSRAAVVRREMAGHIGNIARSYYRNIALFKRLKIFSISCVFFNNRLSPLHSFDSSMFLVSTDIESALVLFVMIWCQFYIKNSLRYKAVNQLLQGKSVWCSLSYTIVSACRNIERYAADTTITLKVTILKVSSQL